MFRKQITTTVFAGAALLTLPLTAHAQTLYGVTFFDNQLIRINPTTGVGTLIGVLSEDQAAYGIAARGGDLYTFDSNADVLRQIDPETAATIATIDIGVGNLLGEGDLAFRSDGVGFLFTAIDPDNFTAVNELYQFDVVAGTSTLLGSTGVTFDALAFRGSTLYGLSTAEASLYTINTATAAVTLVGSLGLDSGLPSSPFAGMTFSSSGTLQAVLDDQMYTINPLTGAATLINPDPNDPTTSLTPTGFGTVSGLTAVAPEPGTLALLLLPLIGVARRKLATK